jgi:hypothetical protein
MASRERDKLNAPAEEQRVGDDQERFGSPADKGPESRVDLTIRGGFEDIELLPDGTSPPPAGRSWRSPQTDCLVANS